MHKFSMELGFVLFNSLQMMKDNKVDEKQLSLAEANVSINNQDTVYSKLKENDDESLINAYHDDHYDGDEQSDSSSFNKIIGGICALTCILTWVGMSELIPLLQSDYKKPYFLRYCVGSCYSLMSIVWLMLNKCNYKDKIKFTKSMIWSSFFLSALYNLPAYGMLMLL